ncbi:MAG: hypothetical protein ACFFEE_07865 [Candidatus Thorarchaeota archaeon]
MSLKKANDFTSFVEKRTPIGYSMLQTLSIGIQLIFLSIVPLLFLLYTPANLNRLGIRMTHPRMIVELLIFFGLLVVGFYLWHF